MVLRIVAVAKHERMTHSDIMRIRMIIRIKLFACVIARDDVQSHERFPLF